MAGGLSMVVDHQFGEDAALNFFGSAMGTTVAGVAMEYERYAPIGEAIAGNTGLQDEFNRINSDTNLNAQQRAAQLEELRRSGIREAALAKALAEGKSRRHGDWEQAPSQFREQDIRRVDFRTGEGYSWPGEAPETVGYIEEADGTKVRVFGQAGDGESAGYTIRKGDTLSELAAKTGVSVEYLTQMNGVDNPNLIYAGDTLKGLTEEQLGMLGGAGGTGVPRMASGDRLLYAGTGGALLPTKRVGVPDNIGAVTGAQWNEFLSAKYGADNVFWDWPKNKGFVYGADEIGALQPGQLIGRLGNERGTFASPLGTAPETLSLRPGTDLSNLNVYRVTKEIPGTRMGPAAPAFDMPGYGTQYELPSSVKELLPEYLERVTK